MDEPSENKWKQIIPKDGMLSVDSTENSPLLRPSTQLASVRQVESTKRYGTLFEDSTSVPSSSELSSMADSVITTASSLTPVQQLSLEWNEINVFVPAVNKSDCFSRLRKQSKPNAPAYPRMIDGKKQVLFGISGSVKPGNLVALMGASGSGKTTTLNVLTQRNIREYKIEGSVTVNGQEVGRNMTSISAYVQQENLLIGALTVKEHLNFQAMLRLPRRYTWAEKMDRAYQVLCELGLKKCEDTKIGIPAQEKRISGGEKKRLAFASEALTNPAIFFCDEPTTGLDSFMAEQVILFLRKMAHRGKTVICTIHQPASEIYALFDSVYMLAEGRLAFSGSLPRALEFFGEQGYDCPKDFNPADFYINTLAVVPGCEADCHDRILKISERFAESQKAERDSDKNILGSLCQTSLTEFTLTSGYRAGWFTQFAALLWRSLLYNYRTKRVAYVRIVQKVIMGLFVGLLYLKTSAKTQTGIGDLNGAMFFMLMQVSMPAVMTILRNLPMEFPILVREHHNGMYSVGSYYWSKVVSYIPLFSVDGIIYVVISYFMIGLRADADAFFYYILIIFLVEQTSAAFGTLLSVVAPDLPTAITISAPVLTLVRLTTGLLTNVGTLPAYISWIQYLSWWRFGYEAALINQWKGYTAEACGPTETTCLRNEDDILAQKSFSKTRFGLDLGMEVVLMSAFYIIGYLVLCIKVYRAR